MTFDDILKHYREVAYSERDKGDRFERLMQAYLQTDPKFAYRFKSVWMWNEFPQRKEFGGSDTGIDLVALTHEGEYWAIQCKFFAETAHIDKKAVDSFLATSSREFSSPQSQYTRFSNRLWISTTNNWGSNAEAAISNQNPQVTRLNLNELRESPVDWDKLQNGITGDLARTTKKTLRPHQKDALEDTQEYFKTHNRGKLIMACGTGKTFTSLRIAENETNGKGLILFLVPSIALLGQTLREWTADAKEPIKPICICSDPRITRQHTKSDDLELFSVVDLAYPASTDVDRIKDQFEAIIEADKPGMTVVFSTYQSIDVIAQAQKEIIEDFEGYGEFDLVICDEAHRTTGFSLTKEDESAFTKVHDNEIIRSKKRLYMTATPRLFGDDAKGKAEENEAILCSMDDPSLYGEEIYRIGFGEAVDRGLLSDYKVLVLTLNEGDVTTTVQKLIANNQREISADDVSKLVGCINALSKQVLGDDGSIKDIDPLPMQRAVAFCSTIKNSQSITHTFNEATETYFETITDEKREQMASVSARHIDGSMSAPERDELLGWLKSTAADTSECRVLTNVRCLSEGVDVPSLDAVMFLSARNSQVDVVQSVGRVMRKAPGKQYGYIIIPVVIPTDVKPEEALNDNERFKVVWSVLNALRAHDDRFNATINKIELNKKKPTQILVGGVLYDQNERREAAESGVNYDDINHQLQMQFEELQGVVFAKLVQKVGDRVYWEKWAKDVAIIAQNQIDRIKKLIEIDDKHRKEFDNFLKGLQENINPSISQAQAIEMLSQHIITKPVFEALFEGYSFVQNNAVSTTMQNMMNLLEEGTLEKESETLQKFYDSVRKRAEGIDNAEGKQRIIIELYDKFFKTAFPKMVEQLGIVYTPVEVVDFILHSVEDVLKQEFGRSLSDEDIHILDPFTGTGTFITRLIQSGLIKKEDLHRKYKHELHANEIVLLAYYIAAVNIENAFHDQFPESDEYESFEGIVLTDTFQMTETRENELQYAEYFPKNSERVERQKKAPIRVIVGNPPYSVGQKSANDNAQNQKYVKLDKRIAETYAARTKATNKNSLYDSYIKAIRWSTDRLDKEVGGIVAFVSNGSWIDGNAQDGLRKVLQEEFSSIRVFNLRGNARTSGELRRKEAGNVFGHGSRTPISITLLIKNPASDSEKATIHYHDIGDYHNREKKLAIIDNYQSVGNPKMKWKLIKPNEHGDWINQRNEAFGKFIPLGDKKGNERNRSFFVPFYGRGIASSADAWVYNYSKVSLRKNIQSTINHYNEELEKVNSGAQVEPKRDSKMGNWTRDWLRQLSNSVKFNEDLTEYRISLYRPFTKQNHYFHDDLNQERYQIPKLFPSGDTQNLVICVSGVGVTKDFSAILSKLTPDLELIGKSQCFPLYYYYTEQETDRGNLFEETDSEESHQKSGISDFIFELANGKFRGKVEREDIFFYVYGILHSPDYRKAFQSDLKKMLPRIPLVDSTEDFGAFSKAGRALGDLHINYEDVPPYKEVLITGEEHDFFKVEKMRFAKKEVVEDGKRRKVDDKTQIQYNSKIVISNIPEKAYEYVVNGKSAIEWIMDRYQVKTDKNSGIKNDPNDWSEEVGNPRYILDLLLSIINVSVQTVDIVEGLPKLEFE